MRGVIYKITSPSNKIYIGQTFNFDKRMRSYRNLDCRNQRLLFRSLSKYGFHSHLIEIIHDYVSNIDELLELEIKYIGIYESYGKGLNLTKGGEGCNIEHHSEETKMKISYSKKNMDKTDRQIMAHFRSFGYKHSSERNEKKSKSQGGCNHWLFGKKMSDNTIKKKSESMILKYKEGYVSPRKGYKLDDQTKEKIKNSKSIPIMQYSNDILIKKWTSAKEASEELNISHGNINACCNGRRKSAGGFIWKFENIK